MSRHQPNPQMHEQNAVGSAGSGVMVQKVVTNLELENTERVLLADGTLTTFLSAHRYISLLYVCFWLKLSYLLCVANSLTSNSPPTVLQCLLVR